MKKKISYLVLFCIMLLPISVVMADGFSSDDAVLAACGFGKYIPTALPKFTSGLYNIVKLLVPIILIVMGMVDFTKAMMSSDEKKMKDSQKKFINRLIAGVVIFLIMAVVQFVFKKIDIGTNYKNGFVNCTNCILNGDLTACGSGEKDLRQSCSDFDYKRCTGYTDDYGNECAVDTSSGIESQYKCTYKGKYCTNFSNNECVGKTDSSGSKCAIINGRCNTECSSINTTEKCETTSHCNWVGPHDKSGNDSGYCTNA